ncbi:MULTISPECIES: Hpt domain-containing protein [unclassified Bradyrhizobium]|uniref:Hpt domain-containing protein n=1 Tax=unclassified Bradyrhizobium TaxID=2631580 RepID=UPI0028EA7BDF|nr:MULTISPECIES: Hpt domain-containing protein [unclassified Bradyrhizobium]
MTAADVPLIDHDQLELLQAALDPSELGAMLVQLPSAADQALSAIKTALAAGDLPQARKAAHVLKGSASSLGAARLAEIARTIELELMTAGEIQACLPVLADIIAATSGELARWAERA